jgi:hypothetical protein
VQLYSDNYEGLIDADNDVAYGIRTMASLLTTGRLHVADRCAGFIDEITGYSWDDKATARGVDAPVKVADHSLDAARYVITTTEPVWRDAAIDQLASRGNAQHERSQLRRGRHHSEIDLMTEPDVRR